MCASGVTCLSADCCLLKKTTTRVSLVQSESHHHLIENDILKEEFERVFRICKSKKELTNTMTKEQIEKDK